MSGPLVVVQTLLLWVLDTAMLWAIGVATTFKQIVRAGKPQRWCVVLANRGGDGIVLLQAFEHVGGPPVDTATPATQPFPERVFDFVCFFKFDVDHVRTVMVKEGQEGEQGLAEVATLGAWTARSSEFCGEWPGGEEWIAIGDEGRFFVPGLVEEDEGVGEILWDALDAFGHVPGLVWHFCNFLSKKHHKMFL
jgi:hypothetical protein